MSSLSVRGIRRPGAAALAALLAFGLLLLGLAVPSLASADTRPEAGDPATVSADALPTVQTDGVVWSMVTVGNTVYATGSFTTATPAGGGAGTPRGNLLAFDIRTGSLIPGFNHTLNGQGRIIVASPDGSRIYVGGDFTTVDGIARGHVAAFDVATGTLVPGFTPNASGRVYSLAATADLVYVGGEFTVAGGQPRVRLAAFRAGDGGLTSWAPTADHIVRGIVVDPTGTRVVLAGQFSQINGIQAYSIASVDTAGGDAQSQPYGIDNHGDPSGAFSLKMYDGIAYATVYGFVEGNMEGTIAFNPTNFDLVWMNDCHGDPYDSWSNGTVVYNANHVHDCETAGSFPDPSPRTWQRATAMTVAATGTLTATTDLPRYTSWEGNPSPTILHFWPTIPAGEYTGQAQGAWSVTGGGDYVVFGGEFTSVNGRPQSNLVRFASPSIAPNDRGPELSASEMRPAATSITPGQVLVRWPSSWDMDNEFLTYRVYRDGEAAPVHEATVSSAWWNMPAQQFTDTVLAGTTTTYRVTVSDPLGNTVTSAASAAVTVASSTSVYASTVIDDGAAQYWRLAEPSGSVVVDYVGDVHLTTGSGVTRGTDGAVDGDGATTFGGAGNSITRSGDTVGANRDAFAVEAWVRTTATQGGVIAQYVEDDPENPDDPIFENTDRALYVDADGRISFGLSARGPAPDRITSYRTVRSADAVNDGQWHHVVASVGSGGTVLYIDGAAVAQDSSLTRANSRVSPGHWYLGNGLLETVPNEPASASFAGAIDEVAVYPVTLTAEQVGEHFAAAGASVANEVPIASFSATPDSLDVAFDAGASTDPDGSITAYAWDFGDGATGTGETADHAYTDPGTYPVTLTVTDNGGATGTTTQDVTVEEPPAGGTVLAEDGFGRTVTDGLGTADTGGPWTASVGANRQSVAPGIATMTLPAAGNNTGSYLDGVTSSDTEVLTTFSVSSMPTGNGTYVYVSGRRVAANQEYRVRARLMADGRVSLALSRLSGGEAFPGGEVIVPGVTFTAGAPLNARVVVSGTSPTEIAATVWRAGTAEPAPQATWSDTTAALQAAGAVGLSVHRPGGTTVATGVRFTAFRAAAPGDGPAPVPNVAPTAAFTVATDELALSVDGTGSDDIDGDVASYAWNWGDGTAAGSGVTASHSYAAAGTYTVTLTVTDEDGATATATESVTVVADPGDPGDPGDPTVLAEDAFGRTVTDGLGAADVGGAWTASVGGNRQSVSSGTATLALPGAGHNTGSFLGEVSSAETEVLATFSVSSLPTGAGTYVYVTGRRVAAGQEYRPRVRLLPTGQIGLALSRLSGGEAFPGGEVVIPGVTFGAGDAINVRVSVTGTGTTEIAATVWRAGTAEPGPQGSWTDTTAALQAPGAVGLLAHRPGSSTAATEVRVTAFSATTPGGGTPGPTPNVAPTAAFTVATDELALSVDGAGSGDTDGDVASYAWNWGDGTAAGSGVTASHDYAAAGTYTVTLTVTDDDGATATSAESVTVAEPDGPAAPAVFAGDTFARTVTDGLGTADVGGAWTASVGGNRQSVTPGTAEMALPAAGHNTGSYLGVSQTSADIRTSFSLTSMPTGNGTYVYVTGRRVGSGQEYRVRVRVTSTGQVALALSRLSGGEAFPGGELIVSGLTYTAGSILNVRVQVSGVVTTQITGAIWLDGTAEPTAPQLTRTDTTAALQAAGGVGLAVHRPGNSTAATSVRFTGFSARAVE